MIKKAKCAICGKDFLSGYPNVKYCSLKCRDTGRIKNRKKWSERNKNYMSAYMQKYRKANKKGIFRQWTN